MRIPYQLRIFGREPTLIIAAGKQDAALYEAKGALIEQVDSFKVEKPYFSDREGGFMTRGKGKTMRAGGAAQEIRDQDIIQHFLQEFKQHLGRVNGAIKRIYILAPAKTKHAIARTLPSAWRDKIRGVIAGNHFRSHPLDLLKKIRSRMSVNLQL